MAIAPFPFDVTMRPTKFVKAVGAVFVSGDQQGFGRYTRTEVTTAQEWRGLTDLATATDDSNAGDIRASSYARVEGNPTFLLGGIFNNFDRDFTVMHAIIMASHDGMTWTTVLDKSTDLHEGVQGFSIQNLVWDETAHWDATANAFKGSFYAQALSEGEEETWESATGLHWSEGGGDFAAHCKGKLPGLPDGLYGYDKDKDILMQPNIEGGIDKTTGKGTDHEITTKIDFGLVVAVSCVAFVGGVWVAGGNKREEEIYSPVTSTSIDDGNTWTTVSEGSLGMYEEIGQFLSITTVVGAPPGDF